MIQISNRGFEIEKNQGKTSNDVRSFNVADEALKANIIAKSAGAASSKLINRARRINFPSCSRCFENLFHLDSCLAPIKRLVGCFDNFIASLTHEVKYMATSLSQQSAIARAIHLSINHVF